MSVVIGVRCSDGIVIGADSAASMVTQGIVTAQQRSMKKVIATGRVLSGTVGSTGLGQRMRVRIESRLNEGSWTGDVQAIMSQMRTELWSQLVRQEVEAAGVAHKTFPQAACSDAARTETLVATVIEGKPELIHLNETCSPALVQDDLPVHAMGLGQPTADPFLTFVKRILWPIGVPNLATGMLGVVWTLAHVIDANPNGIGAPIQLGVLQQRGENWLARELSPDEVRELITNIEEIENDVRGSFSKAKGVTPSPPT